MGAEEKMVTRRSYGQYCGLARLTDPGFMPAWRLPVRRLAGQL
jgi:hypothetical protein